MSGRVALKDALDHHAQRTVERHQTVHRGNITKLDPLTIDVFGYDFPLTLDDDFDLSQWMTMYQKSVGFVIGDLALMHLHDSDWVMVDVVSDTEMPSSL